MAEGYFYGTGRRKSAVARVFMKRGSGAIVVNGKPVDEFFSRETGRMIVRQPLVLTGNVDKFDIKINVCGGGVAGQAQAVRRFLLRQAVQAARAEHVLAAPGQPAPNRRAAVGGGR